MGYCMIEWKVRCATVKWLNASCSLPGIGGIDTVSTNNVNTIASGVTVVVAAIAAVHKVAILISGIAGIVVWMYGSVWLDCVDMGETVSVILCRFTIYVYYYFILACIRYNHCHTNSDWFAPIWMVPWYVN